MLPELLVIQHVDREGPDRIADWACDKGITIQRIRPDRGEALPAVETQKPAVAVMMGGPMGVNERQQPGLDWLEQELAWLKQWLAQGRPALGICLGAQLLCVASGGSIEPLSAGDPAHPLKEVGFGPISWQKAAAEVPWLQGIPTHQLVLHWHGDRCRLSEHAELLASTLHCPEQANTLWGCNSMWKPPQPALSDGLMLIKPSFAARAAQLRASGGIKSASNPALSAKATGCLISC